MQSTLDRTRHLEIVREIATKHEDRYEQRGVQGEDEALEGQLLLEPACGRCTVPHLLHLAHLAHLRVQVVLLRVCNMHIRIHEHMHVQYARARARAHTNVRVAAAASGKRERAQARDVTFPAPSESIRVEFIAGTVGSKA